MRAALITLAALAVAIVPAHAQPPAPKAAIQQFVRDYVKAHNDADATAMMDAVSRDAAVTSISDGEITRGWDAIRTDADEVTGAEGSFKVAVGTMDVTMLGPQHALVTAPTTITVNSEQGLVQLKGAVSLILHRSATGWRILHEHFSTQAAGG